MQPVNPALALYVSIVRGLTEPETDLEHDIELREEAFDRLIPPWSG